MKVICQDLSEDAVIGDREPGATSVGDKVKKVKLKKE
jgi:hypothetical protein